MESLSIPSDGDARLSLVAAERARAYVPPVVRPQRDLTKDLGTDIHALVRGGKEAEPKEVLTVLKRLFVTADVDLSKHLDSVELGEVIKAYYRLEGVSRPLVSTIEEVEKAMKRYDTDRSGHLQFHEFVAMFCDVSPQAVFKFKLPKEVLMGVYRLAMS